MKDNLSRLRSSSASTEKLTKALASTNNKFKKDERYWELTVDKAGNGWAIIRFLDAPFVDGEDGVPFTQIWTHGFQGPGGWYIENSLTTLGKSDPVSEYNSKLWSTGLESNQNIARAQKRQLNFVSNILVVKDPANPANEGKVFLYRYGKTIFSLIQERIPGSEKSDEVLSDPDFKEFNPYNYFDGANFRLSARVGANKRRTYDKSKFLEPSAVGTPEEIEKIWKQSYSLKEVTDPKNFKSYEDLKKRLDRVLGLDGTSSTSTAETSKAEELESSMSVDETDDDGLDVFRKLAE